MAASLFLFYFSLSQFVFYPRAGVQYFKDLSASSFGSFDFVNFHTVPISFSLMSLLRDSKGKLAMLAFPDRRLANSSLLYHHTISVCLSSCFGCFVFVLLANLLHQTDNYGKSLNLLLHSIVVVST